MHDQHGPACIVQQGPEPLGQSVEGADTEYQHLRGRFRELPGKLIRHFAETQLRAHFEPVYGLRLGPRIKQSTYTQWTLTLWGPVRENPDVHRFCRHVTQDAR